VVNLFGLFGQRFRRDIFDLSLPGDFIRRPLGNDAQPGFGPGQGRLNVENELRGLRFGEYLLISIAEGAGKAVPG